MSEFRFPPLELPEPAEVETRVSATGEAGVAEFRFSPVRIPEPVGRKCSPAAAGTGTSTCTNCGESLPCAGNCKSNAADGSNGCAPQVSGSRDEPLPATSAALVKRHVRRRRDVHGEKILPVTDAALGWRPTLDVLAEGPPKPPDGDPPAPEATLPIGAPDTEPDWRDTPGVLAEGPSIPPGGYPPAPGIFPTDLGTAPVSVDFTVEPFEDGSVVYLRVMPNLPGEPSTGLLHLRIDIANFGSELTLTEIQIWVYDAYWDNWKKFSYGREGEKIKSGKPGIPKVTQVELETDEKIKLATPNPTRIFLMLWFQEIGAVMRSWDLKPHAVKYAFPFKKESLKFGSFLKLPRSHRRDGGQFFAYDISVYGWKTYWSLSTLKSDVELNEQYWGWERPIYAMADGVVLEAVDWWPDNPTPGRCAVVRRPQEWTGKTPVDFVATTCVRSGDLTRIVLAAIESDLLVLYLLDYKDWEDDIVELDRQTDAQAKGVRLVTMGSSHVVSAARFHAPYTALLTLWEITKAGQLIKRDSFTVSCDAGAVRMAVLSDDRLVVCTWMDGTVRHAVYALNSGKIVELWQDPNLEFELDEVDSKFDVVRISDIEFATIATPRADAKVQGYVSVKKWNITEFSKSKTEIGCLVVPVDAHPLFDMVTPSSCIGVTMPHENYFGTLTRHKYGGWHITVWENMTPRASYDIGECVGSPVVVQSDHERIAVMFKDVHSGKAKVRYFDIQKKIQDNIHSESANETHEVPQMICASRLTKESPGRDSVVMGMISDADLAKVIVWSSGESNRIRIRHGNEVVTFHHLRQGSIPPEVKGGLIGKSKSLIVVHEGDLIGAIGMSGKTDRPAHVHLQADRLSHEYAANTLDNNWALVEKFRQYRDANFLTFRPLQFAGVTGFAVDEADEPLDNVPMMDFPAFGQLVKMDGCGAHYKHVYVIPWAVDGVE